MSTLPAMARKRSHKMEKLAKIYDTEILPVWSRHFGKLLLRDLDVAPGSQVLDVVCGTGYPATEILRRMGEDSRLIAIDSSPQMLDQARKKIEEMGAKNVFFRTENAEPKLSFADDVYDLVVCNLGLSEFERSDSALSDFYRVTRPGGEVRCSLPAEGSFQEFYDIYQEVLTKHDKHETLAKLQEHISEKQWSVDRCYQELENAGFTDAKVEVDEFTMLFKSSREFFFAPVIEHGPLSDWKRLAGKGQEMQDIFWYIKEAIDAYYAGRAFEVTVKAALLRGRVAEEREGEEATTVDRDPVESESDDSDDEADTAELEGSAPRLAPRAIQIDDDVELDAFIEGHKRPSHLD